jgi:hypothetical protein
MAKMKNVLHDGGIGAAIVNHYNIESAMALISKLATATSQEFANLDQNLTNKVNDVKNLLDQRYQEVKNELEEIRTLAEILNAYEKGQVKEIIEEALLNLDAKGFLERMSVETPTGSVSLKDLVVKTAFREDLSGVRLVIDPETEEIKAIEYHVLNPDGTERKEILNYSADDTKDVTDDNGNYLYTDEVYKKEGWGGIDGLVAMKHVYAKKRPYSTQVGNTGVQQDFKLYIGEDFLIFDIDIQDLVYQESDEEAIKEAVEAVPATDESNTSDSGSSDNSSDNSGSSQQ